jgi:hypothetical protein
MLMNSQRRRRDIFVEPNPNRIKLLAEGHHLQTATASFGDVAGSEIMKA